MSVDPSDSFADDFEQPKKAAKFAFLTLGNKNPQEERREGEKDTPEEGKIFYGKKELGQLYIKDGEGELQKVESFNAVILFHTASRKLAPFRGKETKTLCESFDGLTPSVNIESPFCEELSKDALEKQLLEKKVPEARMVQITKSVTSQGKLNSCCFKGDKGFRWDLCPKSKKDELTGKKPCVYFEKIFIQDLDNDTQYRTDLKGLDLQNWTKYVSPWSEYKKFIYTNKVPYWGAQVKISGTIGPSGFAVWNFTEPKIIDDTELSAVINDAHAGTFDWYNRMAAPPIEGKQGDSSDKQVPLDVDDVDW